MFAREGQVTSEGVVVVKLLQSRVWLARLHRDKNAYENVGLDPLNSIPPIAFRPKKHKPKKTSPDPVVSSPINLIVRPLYKITVLENIL